jgi:hypothetical protein
MISFIRSHWPRISAGLLAVSLLAAGGTALAHTLEGDCCDRGADCCNDPTCPLCHHGK